MPDPVPVEESRGIGCVRSKRCVVCGSPDDLYGRVCLSCRAGYRVSVGAAEHRRCECGETLRHGPASADPRALCGWCSPTHAQHA
jgi:hypothetical protein